MAKKVETILLPDIGEGVVEGEVVEWLKQEGQEVKKDEPVVVVMTDKATVELPSPYEGILVTQHVEKGKTALVDKPLYDVECEGKEVKEKHKREKKPEKEKKSFVSNKKTTTSGKVLAAPKTRGLARALDIDLNQVKGTGKDGRITVQDLKKETTSTDSSKITHLESDEEEDVVGIRQLMAQKMSESKRTAAHFSYFEQVEAKRLVQLRQNVKREAENDGIHLTYMPFFLRALSLTLKKFPYVNSSFDPEKKKLYIHKQHNIGIAIQTKRGLIVPVLKQVQEMNLTEIIHAYEELKQKALDEKLDSKDMKESTITISNYGVLGGGGRWATPIINFPEVAILGINKIQKQPVVKGDQLITTDVLNLSWSFDHRVVDGEQAALFSHFFAELIRNPAALL
jgi:pyruvate dehydrogenase E2 component (dihydrolipoamide acetyltransferase)